MKPPAEPVTNPDIMPALLASLPTALLAAGLLPVGIPWSADAAPKTRAIAAAGDATAAPVCRNCSPLRRRGPSGGSTGRCGALGVEKVKDDVSVLSELFGYQLPIYFHIGPLLRYLRAIATPEREKTQKMAIPDVRHPPRESTCVLHATAVTH